VQHEPKTDRERQRSRKRGGRPEPSRQPKTIKRLPVEPPIIASLTALRATMTEIIVGKQAQRTLEFA
jgi:hypothetical protein